jgi:hypothetical protein
VLSELHLFPPETGMYHRPCPWWQCADAAFLRHFAAGKRRRLARAGMSLSKHHTRQRKTVPIAAGLAMPVLPHANVAHRFL